MCVLELLHNLMKSTFQFRIYCHVFEVLPLIPFTHNPSSTIKQQVPCVALIHKLEWLLLPRNMGSHKLKFRGADRHPRLVVLSHRCSLLAVMGCWRWRPDIRPLLEADS